MLFSQDNNKLGRSDSANHSILVLCFRVRTCTVSFHQGLSQGDSVCQSYVRQVTVQQAVIQSNKHIIIKNKSTFVDVFIFLYSKEHLSMQSVSYQFSGKLVDLAIQLIAYHKTQSISLTSLCYMHKSKEYCLNKFSLNYSKNDEYVLYSLFFFT